jgi:hypothetical protein
MGQSKTFLGLVLIAIGVSLPIASRQRAHNKHLCIKEGTYFMPKRRTVDPNLIRHLSWRKQIA